MNIMTLRCSAASERGDRNENQDNLRFSDRCSFIDQTQDYADSSAFSTDRTQVFCVCDGVGGAQKGDMASSAALMALKEYLTARKNESLEDCIRRGAEQAHEQVQQLYEQLQTVGGSTLVMAGICADRYAALNIGDSPIFLFRRRSGTLTELSVQHTQQWQMLQNGQIPTPGSASRLVHYLGKPGVFASAQAHFCTGILEPGDALLLCSDGVSDSFSADMLRRMLKWRVSARRMVRMAARRQGADNCTAICVYAR